MCSEQFGLELLYLSVNKTNEKARRLYSGLGWNLASPRMLHMRPLIFAPHVSKTDAKVVTVKRLAREAAVELVSTFYADRDLGLCRSGFSRLFSSDNYLATYICADDAGRSFHRCAPARNHVCYARSRMCLQPMASAIAPR